MKTWSKSKILMHIVAITSSILTVILFVMQNFFDMQLIKTSTIIFMLIAYHFDIRLIVGNIVPLFKNKINPAKKRYKLKKFEKKLYNLLKVKKWKNFAPTYDDGEFDFKNNSYEQILVNMCNAELVHEWNALMSLVPIICIIWLSSPLTFILSSVIPACIDFIFVIIQRYNRPRLERIIERNKLRQNKLSANV